MYKRGLVIIIAFFAIQLLFATDDFKLLSLGDGTEKSVTRDGKYWGHAFEFNDKILLCRGDDIHGYELWISDGTTIGTKLLKDIIPGTPSSFPNEFVRIGNIVYFSTIVHDTINDNTIFQIWKTDGTENGTQFLNTAYTYEGYTYPTTLGYLKRFLKVNAFNNKIIYKYTTFLFSTPDDMRTLAYNTLSNTIEKFPLGTETTKVEDGLQVSDKFMFSNGFTLNGRVAHQYYISNGQANGTFPLKNGTTPLYSKHEYAHAFFFDYLWSPYFWQDHTYFYAVDTNDVSGIFKVNTITNQAEMVLKVMDNAFLNPAGVIGVNYFTFNNKMYIHLLLKKDKYNSFVDADSSVIFSTDGTLSGTQQVISLDNKMRNILGSFTNGKLLYKDFQNNILAIDLTNNNETMIDPLDTQDQWMDNLEFYNTQQATIVGNNAYLLRGSKVLKTDGATATVIGNLTTNGYSRLSISNFVAKNSMYLFFKLNSDINNMFTINLSNDAVQLLGEYEQNVYQALNPDLYFDKSNFPTINDISYFPGYNDSGLSLWRTDGSVSGTFSISEPIFDPTDFLNPYFGWYSFNNKVLFGTYSDYLRLYITDGTKANTIKLDSFPSDIPFGIDKFYSYGGYVYYVANNKTICRTNGTISGTQRLKTLQGVGALGDFFEVNGVLYLPAKGNANEVFWKIDNNGTVTSVLKFTDLSITFNANDRFTSHGLLNGKLIFDVCLDATLQNFENYGKHHLMAFDGTHAYYLTNATYTNTFKNNFILLENFVISNGVMYISSLSLADGTLPKATFANIGKDFDENGVLFTSQGNEGDLTAILQFPEIQANLQCVSGPMILASTVKLKSVNNNIYTCFSSNVVPSDFDAVSKSVYRMDGNFAFEKVLDLEPPASPILILMNAVSFDEDGKIYGVTGVANDDLTSFEINVSMSDGITSGDGDMFETLVTSDPSFFFQLYEGGIGMYKEKLYFYIKDAANITLDKFLMCEADPMTKTARIIQPHADLAKIVDIDITRNDGILITGFNQPTQVERPGTSLWFYKNNELTSVTTNLKESIKIYPNPTSTYIQIEMPKEWSMDNTVTIYNSIGTLVFKQFYDNGEVQIPVTSFSSGVYIIEATHNGEKTMGKFIKE
ncbi:MAG: T9SS type A sorting domain-containing protein [Chitinophagales bacterium]|nr:T9SS type A sorting domain-containing protein [Chitinophagales bacterium]